MKTALEELIEYIEEFQPKNKCTEGIWQKAKSLLDTEKQQIIEAATHGANFDKSPYSSAHEYYDETYTTNKETLK